jgi:hypothetical protein
VRSGFTTNGEKLPISYACRNIDVSDPDADRNVNRLNTNASLSGGLCLLRNVGFLTLLSSPRSYGWCHCSVSSFKNSGRTVTEAKQAPAGPIPLNQLQVAVHTASEQHPTPQTCHPDSCVNMDGKLCVKPHGLGPGDQGDLEGCMEKTSPVVDVPVL